MACTHMEALYGGHTCKPWIHLEWTHLDDIYPHGWFKIIRYTWKVWTHLETLNTGAMETLMDSSRQLLWILPDNSYGFFQTTLMDSSRQLLWILPDNSYGFFQTTLMDSSRQLLWILPDNSYGFFQTTLMDSSRSLGSP